VDAGGTYAPFAASEVAGFSTWGDVEAPALFAAACLPGQCIPIVTATVVLRGGDGTRSLDERLVHGRRLYGGRHRDLL
jgi:hypothetical protein